MATNPMALDRAPKKPTWETLSVPSLIMMSLKEYAIGDPVCLRNGKVVSDDLRKMGPCARGQRNSAFTNGARNTVCHPYCLPYLPHETSELILRATWEVYSEGQGRRI